MSFDWLRFLDANRIEYRSHGANTSAGNIAIHCPFCGHDDQSMHLSVSITGRGWRCFRRPDTHHGKAAARLVAALIGCSPQQASKICGEQVYIPDDFIGRVGELLQPSPDPEPRDLRMPAELRPFSDKPSCRPFIRYLRSRGHADLHRFTDLFDVRYATTGFFRYRVVLPVTFNDRLVSLTGRAINADANIRYLTLPTDPEKVGRYGLDPALGPISEYLLWYDQCLHADADTIYLVEGPFDAFKVWQLGIDDGIVATCFFTATASSAQIDKLHTLLPKFKRRYLLLDRGTLATSMRLQQQLYGLGVVNRILPNHIKDPGTLKSLTSLQAD